MFIHTYSLKNDVNGCGSGPYGGGPWHVASFARQKNYYEIGEWCYETFGEPDFRWADEIFYGEVYFKHEEDLMLFVLRWS